MVRVCVETMDASVGRLTMMLMNAIVATSWEVAYCQKNLSQGTTVFDCAGRQICLAAEPAGQG